MFPPVAQGLERCAAPHATDDNSLHSNALAEEVKLLHEMLDAMREDRDAWRERASNALAVLPLPALILSLADSCCGFLVTARLM